MALWALWEYFRSRAEFGLQELLVGGVVGGFLLLFFSVLRQRLAELPHDRYRRIEK